MQTISPIMGFAIAAVLLSVPLCGQDAPRRIAEGQALLSSGRPAEAEKALAAAVELDARSVVAWNLLGHARYAQSRWDTALEAYSRALAMAPGEAKLHANAGMCRFEMHAWDEALSHFREALRIDPRYGKPHLYVARIAAERGDAETALRSFRRAAEVDPSDPVIRFHLGLFRFKRREWAEAVRDFEACLALSPDMPSAHLNLGQALLRLGDRARGETHIARFKALTDVTLAAEQLRVRVATRLNGARREMDAGRLDAAMALIMEARELAPDVPQVHAFLAEIHARQGRPEESRRARAEFERLSRRGDGR